MFLKATLVLVFSIVFGANAVNILLLTALPSHSHHFWNNAIGVGLAAHGHNVTIVTPYLEKTPARGVHYIRIENVHDVATEYGKDLTKSNGDINIFLEYVQYLDLGLVYCEGVLKSDAFQILNQYPDDFKFDLIVYDFTMGPCLLAFMHKFKYPPMVITTAYTNPTFLNHIMGGNHYYSYVPHSFLPFNVDMTFWQRIQNFALHVEEYVLRRHVLPKYDDLVLKYFGSGIPPMEDLERRAAVAFVNTHPVMDYHISLPENVIPVAGLHIKEAKPLPKDMDEFFNASKKGAVLFSLGTLLRSEYMPIEKQKLFINVFSEFPDYHFLWKFESNVTAEELPKNVQIRPWVPQSDILAHPKLKTFITHGGLHSTQESIWRGVPIIVMPFAFDQQMNLLKVKQIDMAEGLDFFSLTAADVRGTLKKILEDPKYAANAKRASAHFKDQKETPLERVVWWIEWVLRNPDCDYLKSPVPRLGYIVGNSLDLIAFVTLAIAAVSIIIVKVIVWSCNRVLYRKSRSNQHKKVE